MPLRIVDNKKVDMTDHEFDLYEKIVKSYTNLPYQKGEDLFMDLFESDDNGIIVFLRPPTDKATTLEIFLFLVSLMNQQHLRAMYAQIEDLANQVKQKLG
jgi:hypothetical protein